MTRLLRFKFHLIVLAAAVIQASCISRTTHLPKDQQLLPAKTATRQELLELLQARSTSVRTFQGKPVLDLSGGGPKTGVLTKYTQTTGYVLVDRPSHIRVKVLLPIVLSTVLDMVSDGHELHLSIPVKNQCIVGDANAPPNPKYSLGNLRPQHFLDGLFVDVRPHLSDPRISHTLEEAIEGQHSFYVFSFISAGGKEAQLIEKIWIDRTDMQIARKQIFGKDGKVETDARYSDYQDEGGIPFPKIVTIQLPIIDYTVKMTFQKTNMNEKLDENTFNLECPEGAELMKLLPAGS